MSISDQIERELRRTAPQPHGAPELSEAAAAEGLLDVAYATLDSPLGALLLAVTPNGLVRLAYLDDGGEEEATVLEELAANVSPRVLASPRKLDEPRRELDQYFSGRRRQFDVRLDWQLTRGFARRVLEATAQIPFGATATYKQVATQAGSARAYRAAGNALGSNPIPIIVPCHRILHSGGGLGGYTGGLDRKRVLLAVEGSTTG
ncbi:MAG TPA: methylated-DNA--[protein]-cysteine S-methyltransferase [Solirubrobacteraceae bacterium]|jgi:methylated-DNA-[protein]-cysteine S-methyltransferase